MPVLRAGTPTTSHSFWWAPNGLTHLCILQGTGRKSSSKWAAGSQSRLSRTATLQSLPLWLLPTSTSKCDQRRTATMSFLHTHTCIHIHKCRYTHVHTHALIPCPYNAHMSCMHTNTPMHKHAHAPYLSTQPFTHPALPALIPPVLAKYLLRSEGGEEEVVAAPCPAFF